MEKITLDQISNKLKDRPCSLYKTFEFSMEDLQDNPEKHVIKIQGYLNKHREHYDDFVFHSETDPNTFKPSLTVQLFLNEEHRKHSIEQYQEFIDYLDKKNK